MSDRHPSWGIALPVVSRKDVFQAQCTLTALWDRIAGQDDFAARQHDLHQALQDQINRGDRLEEENAKLNSAAAPFVTFVQRRYDLLRHQYDEACRSRAEFASALVDRRDQSDKIARLRKFFFCFISFFLLS